MNLRSKMPAAGQIAQVFAVTCLMIYGWSTYGFLDRRAELLKKFDEIAQAPQAG